MATILFALQGISDAVQHDPIVAVALLFGAGVLTSTNPCIWPMIPITLGVITGNTAGQVPRRRIVALTLTYIAGLALFYSLLGVLAGLTGSLFGTVGSSPWARLGVGILLLVFGLALLDVIPVPLPQRLIAWAGGLGGGSYPAVLLLGATSGIVAAPCGAPAFLAVLTWVAATRSAVWGFVYLFVFSLGMTAVLAGVGLFSGTLAALPRAGQWMVWIKKAGGVVLLAMAVYYFIQVYYFIHVGSVL